MRELAATVSSPLVTACDVRSDEDVGRVFGEVSELWPDGLDLLVHSVAFAAAEDLEGRFTDTPRDRFCGGGRTPARTRWSRQPGPPSR